MARGPGPVAPDGSPVEVFRALPAGAAPGRIHAALGAGASILDLGCGAGRLAHPLAELGHVVVGVDRSPAMLSSVRVPRVCADIRSLPIHGRFDAVLLASYLINDDPNLLAVCRDHVRQGGAVLVQRYSPSFVREAVVDAVTVGDVTVGVRDFDVGDRDFRMVVTYRIGGSTWDQPVGAQLVDEEELTTSGLRFERWLDEFETWALLTSVA